jgi:hypothetical protein
MRIINNVVLVGLVAAYLAATRLSLMFALTGWEIDQYECWNDRSFKLRSFVGIQDLIREKATKPLRAAMEARVGGEFLLINGKIVLR